MIDFMPSHAARREAVLEVADDRLGASIDERLVI
jgi:hypothetical protein